MPMDIITTTMVTETSTNLPILIINNMEMDPTPHNTMSNNKEQAEMKMPEALCLDHLHL